MKRNCNIRGLGLISLLVVLALLARAGILEEPAPQQMTSLLPAIDTWSQTEESQNYFPENLFEYINGAAEIYLSYDFHELIVAQYQKIGTDNQVAVEIYDMGTATTSFGIYSAERYTDNVFIPIGVQGYLEEGSLNFLVGRYYIKLLCFDCGDASEQTLQDFAQGIVTRVKNPGGFPGLLQAFPVKGRLANSEKFILHNVMGYGFLHHGFMANYRLDDMDFDCFVLVGKDVADAQNMLDKYLEAKGKNNVKEIPHGYLIQDKYYHNIYISRVGHFLSGVMKIKDGKEKIGEEYLASLKQELTDR
jgi:hypothetical protein